MPTRLASLGGPGPQHAGGSEDGGLGRKVLYSVTSADRSRMRLCGRS